MAVKLVGALVAALLLTACQTEPIAPATTAAQGAALTQERISFESERATDAEREKCHAAGGEVHQAGLLGYENCILPYADAGQACSDSSECLGDCRLTDFSKPEDSITGTCQINDSPFGCYQTVENGRAGHMLCVD